jgi:polysaccharide export outer membrane protein
MRRFIILVSVWAPLLIGAVAQAQTLPYLLDPEFAVRTDSYTLSPGDKLKITVFNVPDITGEYALSPTGEIGLPLLGAINAAGMSPDHLSEFITGKLAKGYVNNPKVTVEVTNFRPFYILGEINHPGEFPYKATMTIEQAIATAGGYTYRAARHSAYLRRTGEGERLIKFGDKPTYVMPGDTIRVGVRYF